MEAAAKGKPDGNFLPFPTSKKARAQPLAPRLTACSVGFYPTDLAVMPDAFRNPSPANPLLAGGQ
jgi:hypothetical protein